MKGTFKRLVAMFLLGCMIMTCMPDAAWADENTAESSDAKGEEMQGPPGGGMPPQDGAPAQSAIYIADGAETGENEYEEGAYGDYLSFEEGTAFIRNLAMTSGDYGFNGIVATGADTIVRLEDSSIDLQVDEAVEADAEGGSAIAVDDGATMYISRSQLTVDGAARYTTSNYNDGTLIVNDSSVVSTGNNENTSAIAEPFSNAALLISGTARANFSIGASKTYYFNSECIAEGWAALSTDSATGDGLDLYAYHTQATAQNGGYATYADTNCRVWLYASSLKAAEIGAIISKTGSIYAGSGAAASADILQYNEGETSEDETVIAGGRNAVMMHAPDMMGEGASAASTGVLTVKDSALVTTKELISTKDYSDYGEATAAYVNYVSGADILVKSTSADITLENARLESYSGVLVQTVLNSDSMGNFLAEEDGAQVEPVTVSICDMEADGDILHMDYQRRMTVSLEDTTLTGKIVSGTFEDWNSLWSDYTAENGYEGSDVNWLPDSEWDTVYGVSLELKDGAVWNAEGISTLSSLTVAENAVLNGVVTVDGETIEPVPGVTYTGDIVVEEETAETPVLIRQPRSAQYSIGKNARKLSVKASVSQGELSYQWYRNTKNSNEGGTAIAGATDSTYTPSTKTAGTVYYYVVVTNTYHGKTASVASQPAKIQVKKQQQKIYAKNYYVASERSRSFGLNATLLKGDGRLTYVSGNTKVVRVDTKGNVTIVGSGTAVITIKAKETASFEGTEKRVKVIVTPGFSWDSTMQSIKL